MRRALPEAHDSQTEARPLLGALERGKGLMGRIAYRAGRLRKAAAWLPLLWDELTTDM